MITDKIDRISLNSDNSIMYALKKMDETGHKVLIVKRGNIFIGLITIGDIQRAIINNVGLEANVETILRDKFDVASPTEDFLDIKSRMIKYRAEIMPVIDKNSRIIDVLFWEDLFEETHPIIKKQFNLPVVIMAGGFGTRMKPLTNVLPKALIPIGEKTIIEEIIGRFADHGCTEFRISLNYKAELIKYFINNLNLPVKLSFFEEDKPLGTAGSLSLIKNQLINTFFVSNCDIIIDQDYSEILGYHYDNKNDITIVASLKHIKFPYGIIETGEKGSLKGLREKPEMVFKINSGMYILEPKILNLIPQGRIYHITQLIDDAKKNDFKIGVFPVSQGSYRDFGSLDDYIKNIWLK